MSHSQRKQSAWNWVWPPLLGAILCTPIAATFGSWIGESRGTAEGEGFIGFIYGLYIGPLIGLLLGLGLAWVRARRMA